MGFKIEIVEDDYEVEVSYWEVFINCFRILSIGRLRLMLMGPGPFFKRYVKRCETWKLSEALAEHKPRLSGELKKCVQELEGLEKMSLRQRYYFFLREFRLITSAEKQLSHVEEEEYRVRKKRESRTQRQKRRWEELKKKQHKRYVEIFRSDFDILTSHISDWKKWMDGRGKTDETVREENWLRRSQKKIERRAKRLKMALDHDEEGWLKP